jgi:hypothetical protein
MKTLFEFINFFRKESRGEEEKSLQEITLSKFQQTKDGCKS